MPQSPEPFQKILCPDAFFQFLQPPGARKDRKSIKLFAIFLMGLVFTSCATGPSGTRLETVPAVDLQRYQGKWYEIARLPNRFQKDCIASTATYGLLESGRVSVLNECTTESGKRKTITGSASVVDKETNAKLEVTFDNWFFRLFSWLIKGKYWILYLDPDYQTVIVGTPDRKYLWIMARTPTMDEKTYQELVQYVEKLGFKGSSLIRERHV